MEKYKNEEYLKQEIIEQSRHQLIYGYNGTQRKQFLENMANNYPIVLDKEAPMAIYVTEFGLPKCSTFNNGVNQNKVSLISDQFLSFSIASDIILKAKMINDANILNERLRKLIEFLNKSSRNRNYSSLNNIDDLMKTLLQSKEFYKRYYVEYQEKGKEETSIDELILPFISLDIFTRYFKKAINNDSYFGIIIDKQEEMSLPSTRSINLLVGRRMNKDISMKIVTEPDKWDSYKDSNGNLIEAIHDYGVVELDDSLSQYSKKLKQNMRI